MRKIMDKKIRTQKNKTLFGIALILILIASTIMASLPVARSQSTAPPGVPQIPTYAYLVAVPNPVGVGQTVVIGFWLDKVPPTASGASGDRWQNMTVKMTRPDGTTQIFGPYMSDPVAQYYFNFVPDKVGTYYFQFSFPGQRVTGLGASIPLPVDNYYLPSTSQNVALVVQQQPIEQFPSGQLPTGYWIRPIEGYNREWYTISGNWLALAASSPFGHRTYNATGNFNPYTTAPSTAHIVWTKPITPGGLMGGEFGGGGTGSYNWGNTYEPMFVPPVIINGVLYYNAPVPPREGYYAVDLRTGKTLWWQNGTGPVIMLNVANGYYGVPGITLGQIFNYISPNQYGGAAYLWYTKSTTWYMYDAGTGNLILSIANATDLGNPQTGGTIVEGPNGELLIYRLSNNRLFMWNSTLCIGTLGNNSTYLWCWRPIAGSTLNWYTGIQWNVSALTLGPLQAISNTNGEVIVATTGNYFLPQNWQMEVGYSAIDGHVLWTQNRTTPTGATSFSLMGPIGNGIYTEFHQSTTEWYGFNIYTGLQVWGPTDRYTNAWGFYDSTASIAYGKLYATGYDGTIHCFDANTGTHLWDWSIGSSGYETAYGTWPLNAVGGFTIADGKIFVGSSHGLVQPMYRGAQLYCIDANLGKELWSVNAWCGSTLAVSDGYLVTLNGYDNQIYCFGKGLTATAVTAPNVGVPQGSSVLIQGTVTDQSPGAKAFSESRILNVAAVSDSDQKAWMEYLYEQQPKPTNTTGVPVHLTAIDPNGNFQDLGNVTTNALGNYAIQWTPPVPGLYTITATFEGSNSYYSSEAGTSFAVSKPTAASPAAVITPQATLPTLVTPTPAQQTTAPTIAPTPSPVVIPPTSSTPTITYVAIGAVVIIIVAIAAALALKRRK
jgi:outer membrane protein assembly factor BamB